MPATSGSASTSHLPLAARLLRAYLRTRLRGRTRLARFLALRLPSLQRVPVQVATGQTLYLDMRDAESRALLCRSPVFGNPHWEPDEQAVMRRIVRAGEVAFDVGAHFGEHAVLLSQIVGDRGRVVAFEPNPELVGGLRRTLAIGGNGQVLQYALSDGRDAAVLFVPDAHASAGLADWTQGQAGPVRSIPCRTASLDALVEAGEVPLPQFVKCDVEGAELRVFRGAAKTLDRPDAPFLLYEANRAGAEAFGCSIAAATEFLTSLRAPAYSIFWVRPGGNLAPVAGLPSDVDLFNLLAVPAARRGRVG